jgi:hypothetical protein
VKGAGVTELGELRSQLLAQYDRGISFLLDHYMVASEAGAATLICDHAARRVLRGERPYDLTLAVHQACVEYVDDYQVQSTRLPTKPKRGSRALIALLGSLDELDRQVVLRYYLSSQGKSVICRALELSDYHFNQILTRTKTHYVRAEPDRSTAVTATVDELGDLLDRYVLGQLSKAESKATEIAILEKPELVGEVNVIKDLITDLRSAHLPRRWRRIGDWEHPQVNSRLDRRRRGRGVWRFLTRRSLGAAASLICVIGIFGSWAMGDMQRVTTIINQPATFAATTNTIPLRVAQTRGYRPSALLKLPGEMRVVSVSLDIGTPQNQRYKVSLLDADGEICWQQHGVIPGSDEMLRFVLSSDVLTAGVHRFLVEPIDEPGHRIQLAFQVETFDSA